MSRQSKPFIEVFSTLGNPFQTSSYEADDDNIEVFEDKYLEAHGAKIKETQIYFPESRRTIVRKK